MEWNHLCNFGRVHNEEQFCEIISNLEKWLRRRYRLEKNSYLELWPPLCLAERNHLTNNGRGHHEEQFRKVILNLDQWPFKDIFTWQHFCLSELNHLCNFGRRYYEEQFCETILNLGQWFRRCRLKDFLSRALGALLFSGA